MNIIICDDNPGVCLEISNYITEHFNLRPLKCTSAEALINAVEKCRGNTDAIILDIVLGGNINGIEVADKIHTKYPLIKIIFLTGYDDIYYKKIFSGFQPFGFIAKPIQYNILNFFIKKIELETEKHNKVLEFVSDYKECRVPLKDVIYIQSRKRICEIITEKQVYKTYMKISQLEKSLTDCFVRCHQSYIVNLSFTDNLTKNQLKLKSGDNIPVSRKYSSDIAMLIAKKSI